jgi:hypothetical protein
MAGQIRSELWVFRNGLGMRHDGEAACARSDAKRRRAGNGAMRKRRTDLAFLIVGVAFCPPALAQSASLLSGAYVCAYGCRLTDAPPSIAIDGDKATCTNEYGGLFRGRLLADNVVSCFNKTGRLLEDGKTVRWDDGVIWQRHARPADR